MGTTTLFRRRSGILASIILGLAGCAETLSQSDADMAGLGPDTSLPPEARAIIEQAKSRRVVPMIDGAAPEVFQATDLAMWDGKPTFGDVWVAVAGVVQPERVEIRNEDTGKIVRASMLIEDRAQTSDARFRLSSGAAQALGVAPLQSVRVTITAIRKSPVHEDAAVVLPEALARPDQAEAMALAEVVVPGNPPRIVAAPPAIEPGPYGQDFVEVAQAFDAFDASRVYDGLQAQSIPVEIQEDFLRGESIFRVFASTKTSAQALFAALDQVRYANGAEGSESSTLIAELPNFIQEELSDVPDWVEVGLFSSRNEAMSVVQRLSRTNIPTEICDQRQGLLTTYRVFAGPSDSDARLFDPVLQDRISDAFCMGVAATDASRPVSPPQITTVSAPEIPSPLAASVKKAIPDGAVRIKVGEATGDLKLRIASPYSVPVLIPAGDLMVSVPKTATPEQVDAIRRALAPLSTLE